VKDRRVLPNGEIEEWERGRSTPDDFIYDPETNCYYAPGEPYYWKEHKTEKELQEIAEYWRLYEEREAAKAREESLRRESAAGAQPKRSQQPTLFADPEDDVAAE